MSRRVGSACFVDCLHQLPKSVFPGCVGRVWILAGRSSAGLAPGMGRAVSYTAAGLLYALWVVSGQNSLPPASRLTWILTITGPAFVIAGLYLANWLRHDDLWSVY